MINKIIIFLKQEGIPCWTYNNRQLETLQKSFPDKKIINCENRDMFLTELEDADIAVIWTFKTEWLNKAEKLKIIATPAAGKDFFRIETERNIHIENSSFHGKIMAETVAAMILSHSRGIIKSFNMQNSGQWPRKDLADFMKTLRTSTVCIVGFGNIGQHIARLLKCFSARIIGIKRNIIETPDYMQENDIIDTIDNLDKYLPLTDHLVLCVPRDSTTNDLINRETIRLLPKHSVIHNVGRGNVINETDLAEALRNNTIAAAYLDVFKEEPLPMDSELRSMKNCIIMPHSSAISPEYLDLFNEEIIDKIKKWDNEY